MTPTAPTPTLNTPRPPLPDESALHALADGRLPPEHAERLRANPLGIYVNAISWSREMSQ